MKKSFIHRLIILFLSILFIWTYFTVSAYDFMIICPDEFEAALTPLIAHKSRTGFSTRIVTIGEINYNYRRRPDGIWCYDDAERVKSAIYDHYINHDIEYVMLVGDCNVMPVRYVRGYLDDYTPDDEYPTAELVWDPTDVYYADVVDSDGEFDSWDHDDPPNQYYGEIYRSGGVNWDNIDYHPDVYIGRIPASDVVEVQNYVTKIIRYEYMTEDQPWFYNMIFSAHDLGGWDPIGLFEATITEMSDKGFLPVRLYDDQFYNLVATPTATPTPTPFPEYPDSDGLPVPERFNYCMNVGVGFIFHSGHGDPRKWNHCYNVDDDMGDLDNEFKLPVIFAVSCDSGRYCPYVPHNDYTTTYGETQEKKRRKDIGTWECPEPDCYQISHNKNSMAEGWLVESLTGAIAYYGCTSKGEKPAKYLGRRFFNSYAPGITLGEMWLSAYEDFYEHFNLSRYDHDFSGSKWDSIRFHHPERFHLFGDPTLRVGGYPFHHPDTTPPITTDNVDREWYGRVFTLELTPTDADSGIRDTQIQVVGSPDWIRGRSHVFRTPGGTTSEFTVRYFSEDFFDNVEPVRSVSFRMDGIKPDNPTMTMDGDPPTMAGADYGGPVTVTVDSDDHESGLASISYILDEKNHYGDYVVAERDYMVPPHIPWTFTISRPGDYRLRVYGTDEAGNDSNMTTEEFLTFWLPENDWFRDLAHILQGPAMLALPPKLDIPFDPDGVRFYFRLPNDQWNFMGTDQNGGDGWGLNWETQKIADAVYDVKAEAFHYIKSESRGEETHEILMGRYAVLNRDEGSYKFFLDIMPRTVDRDEMVKHKITFSHTDSSPMSNLEILFDLAGSNQYNPKGVEIFDNGEIDQDGVIHWIRKSLDPSTEWSVQFSALPSPDIPSNEQACSHAYFRCDQIPVATSDDPDTSKVQGDPSCFTILATNGKVSGKVMDAYLLQALEGTTVTLNGHGITHTDEDGFYLFTNVIGGKYNLSASHPPEFGQDEAEIESDGTSITENLILPRLDRTPPRAAPDNELDYYIAQGYNEITGKAKDNPTGAGVNKVEVAIMRFSNGNYWDGTAWIEDMKWFTAKGKEKWSVILTGLNYEKEETYQLFLRATDAEGNSGTSEYVSKPPAPGGLKLEEVNTKAAGKLRFSWDPVPGCDYLLEVRNNPYGGESIIYEYLGGTQYETESPLPGGLYFWRVYSHIDSTYSDPSEGSSFFTDPLHPGNGVFIY